MNRDKLRFNLKKILKSLKILKKKSPDWDKIISSKKKIYEEFKFKAKNGEKILICTSTGGQLFNSHFEALLALALTRYGANVEIMLCDKALNACSVTTTHLIDEEKYLKNGQKKICNSCLDSGREAFEDLGLKINYYSSYISDKEIHEINSKIQNLTIDQMIEYTEDNVSIGEHSYAGVLRFFAVGTLEKEKNGEVILKKYLQAGLITKKVFFNFFSKENFNKIILNHAIYVPQGIICDVSKVFKIKIVAYSSAYKQNSFLFSWGDTYHKNMIDEDIADWINITLDKKKEENLFNYLDSRKYGTQDMYSYFKNPSFSINSELKSLGVDIKKPIIGLLPNIIWDAQIIYKNNLYKDMTEWLITTIKYLSRRNDIEIVVRCHPGEINGDRLSKQRVKDTILENFNEIPNNLKIIDSSSNISTYVFADYCETLIIYGTKMGIEFTPYGNKVVVAGESYIKNKGITLDPKTKEEYYKLLDKLPNTEKMTPERIEKAKKYAYHYFFKRTITVSSLNTIKNAWPPFEITDKSFEDIINDKDEGLKCISQSIINDNKFILEI
ncbi:hypothetical protein OAD13_04435 [Candidatus Pelagibacter sp.]|nr:hypothetical protein [Candidatus Pelagibacter sp.]